MQFKDARPGRRQNRDSAPWAHIVEQPIRHDAVRLALHRDLIIAALGHRRGERVRSLHVNTADGRPDNKALPRLELTEDVTRRHLETKRFTRGARSITSRQYTVCHSVSAVSSASRGKQPPHVVPAPVCIESACTVWQPASIALIRALRSSRRHSQTIGFLVDTDHGDSIRTIGSAERIDLEIRSTSSPYLFSKRWLA